MSKKFKRIFWDIETSPMILTAWRTGKQYVGANQILEPQKIICICWNVEGEDKVHEVHWNEKTQDDRDMILAFLEVAKDADQLVAHNGDNFDMKFFKYRCLVHGIPFPPNVPTVDTYKWAKAFFLNSRRLNEIDQELGGDGKMDTGGLPLWIDTVIYKQKKALNKMIRYCKKDVKVLKRVFYKLAPYFNNKVHVGVVLNDDKATCGHCGSEDLILSKTRVTSTGIKKRQMLCKSCGHYHTMSDTVYQKFLVKD
jgi:hypothetical protein